MPQDTTSKKLVTLRFSNLHSLWYFARSLSSPVFKINTAEFLLTCECTLQELNSALEQYKATPVQEMSEN